MLMSLTTKGSGSIRLFARRANRSLGIKWLARFVWRPLNHSYRQWFVNELPLLIRASLVQGQTDVSCRPRGGSMAVPNAAHVPGLEILFTFFAHRESRIWELYIQALLETGRRKRQNILQLQEILFCEIFETPVTNHSHFSCMLTP